MTVATTYCMSKILSNVTSSSCTIDCVCYCTVTRWLIVKLYNVHIIVSTCTLHKDYSCTNRSNCLNDNPMHPIQVGIEVVLGGGGRDFKLGELT